MEWRKVKMNFIRVRTCATREVSMDGCEFDTSLCRGVGWAMSRLTRSGRWVAEGIDEFHLCPLSLAWVWHLPLHTSWTRVEQIDEIWSSRWRWYRWISSFFVRTCIVNQEQIPRLCLFLGVLQTRSSTRRRGDEAGRVGVREGGLVVGTSPGGIGRDLKVGLFLVEKGKKTNKRNKQTNRGRFLLLLLAVCFQCRDVGGFC